MMRTFMVGDKAHKVNSQPGDWLDDGAEVTITKVHDNGSVSVNHGGSIDLVVDVNKLQRVTPAATPPTGAPTAGEGARPRLGDTLTPKAMTDRIQELQRENATLQADNARLADELARARALLVDVHRIAPQQEPEAPTMNASGTPRLFAIAHSYWNAGKLIHAFLSGEDKQS